MKTLNVANQRKTHYNERTAAEKIQSNWNKTCGLYRRGEYSMSVIRAATTVELAANLVIREEFEKNRNLPVDFVNHLMKWANGLIGKLKNLIIPICNNTEKERCFKSINEKVRDINDQRNGIVHRGEFKRKRTSKRVINEAREVIQIMVRLYDSEFSLSLPNEDSDN